MRKIVLLGLLLISFSMCNAQALGTIKVTITNAASDEGKVLIGLYNSEANFLKKTHKGTMSKTVEGKCEVEFKDLPYGEYAVSIFHDENDNNKLDSNFMGIPKEDNACSNNAKGFMGPPKYKDAKFMLNKDSIIIPIKF